MELLFTLPNGEVLDLLDEGPNGMEYICLVCGQYETPVSQLIENYRQETDWRKRVGITEKIRAQAYFFAGSIGDFDEELQQMISLSDLAEQIYNTLVTFCKTQKIEDLNQRYRTLKEDVKQAIIEAVQPFGGEYHFVTTDDEKWKEGAEPDVLGLPYVDGCTYYGERYESFYVTSVRFDKYGLEFYGIPENYGLDENDCVDLDDTVDIYDISLPNMIGILECLPKSN